MKSINELEIDAFAEMHDVLRSIKVYHDHGDLTEEMIDDCVIVAIPGYSEIRAVKLREWEAKRTRALHKATRYLEAAHHRSLGDKS
jgi:hypothetical protein